MQNSVKRFASVLLVLAFVLAVAAPAFAASKKIDNINHDFWDSNYPQVIMNGNSVLVSTGRSANLEDVRVTPDVELRIYLSGEMFLDEDGNPFSDDELTLSVLRSGRVGVSMTKTQNTSVFEEVTLEYDRDRKAPYIKFQFIELFASTGRRNFHADVRLRVNGKVREETSFYLGGRMENSEIDVEEGTNFIYLEHTQYASPEEDLTDVTVDVGNGVTFFETYMYSSLSYYAAAKAVEAPEAENAVIALAYEISHVNMALKGTVNFSLGQTYYVYDTNGDYVGTTAEALPVLRGYLFCEEEHEYLEVEGRRVAEESDEADSGSGGSSGRGGGGGRS